MKRELPVGRNMVPLLTGMILFALGTLPGWADRPITNMLNIPSLTARGPTPYPTDPSDWPGVGVIRVFPYMSRNRDYFWTQRSINHGAIVFVGDSNIAGWKTLKKDFSGFHVANLGIGGEVTRGTLFRLKEDVIDIDPTGVVILIGSNDMSAKENISFVVKNIVYIANRLRAYNSRVPIIICKLPPRDDPKAPVSANDIVKLNELLDETFRQDNRIKLLDLPRILGNSDGSFNPQNFLPDRIHISAAGYQKFHDAVLPEFKELGMHE